MKRQTFRITSNLGHDDIKHTWNSAVSHTETIAKELAQQGETFYHLTDKESVKEGFDHVSGYRSWTSQKDGSIVVFTIVKNSHAKI